MNENQEQQLIQTIEEMSASLATIAGHLEDISFSLAPLAPNYHFPIAAFVDFDWRSIGAVVTKHDAFGPMSVLWNRQMWTRRSPENKFGEAVWFSRPEGKKEDGEVRYIRLVTFSDKEDAGPISRKVEATLAKAETALAKAPPEPPAPAEPNIEPPRPAKGTGPLEASHNQDRPYIPKMVKAKIRDLAMTKYADEKASRDQRNQLAHQLPLLFKGQPGAANKGSAVLRYVTGQGAELELADAWVLSVLFWIHATTSTGILAPDPLSAKEAVLIYKEVFAVVTD